LSNEKLQRVGIQMPQWQDSLARYVADLKPTLTYNKQAPEQPNPGACR
jgi:hypothetical protein